MQTLHASIILGQTTVPYTIRFSSCARKYHIAISQSGVELVLPEGSAVSQAPNLMAVHAEWILHHIQRLEKIRKKSNQIHLPPGIVFFQGKPYKVNTITSGISQPLLLIDQKVQKITLKLPARANFKAITYLEALLQKQARLILKRAVRQRASQMGLKPTQITIRDQRTRWGSCSSKGTISLNWRLVLAPPEVLNYVIVHELCHLVEHNHSNRFWAQVEKACPHFKQYRQWLKLNGTLLHPVI